MNIWKFYKLPDGGRTLESFEKNNSKVQLSDVYVLYAITNKRKLAKKFMKERDMTKFYLIKDDEVTDKEFTAFANKHRSALLDEYVYVTYCDIKDKYVKKKVKILSTYSEYMYVSEACENGIFEEGLFDQRDWFNPRILKDEYFKALTLMMYTEHAEFILALNSVYPKESDENEDDDYMPPSLTWDEVNLLLENHKELFK